MAPSAAMSTTVTFSAVSTISIVTITAQTGFLTTSSIGWTSVTVGGSSAANIAPTSLAFAVTVTNTLAQGQTLTITASSAVWSTTQPSSCTTGVANAVGAFVTTPTSLVVTAGTATLASGATTITCVGGLALNPSVATTVTFGAVSEVSTIPITEQSGYTTTEVAPRTFVSVEPSSLLGLHALTYVKFTFRPTTALIAGDTITIHNNNVAIFKVGNMPTTCAGKQNDGTEDIIIYSRPASTTTSSDKMTLSFTLDSAVLSTANLTITCTGNLANNGGHGSTVNFQVKTSRDVVFLPATLTAESVPKYTLPNATITDDNATDTDVGPLVGLIIVIVVCVASIVACGIVVVIMVVLSKKKKTTKKVESRDVEMANVSEVHFSIPTGAPAPEKKVESKDVEMANVPSIPTGAPAPEKVESKDVETAAAPAVIAAAVEE